MSHILLMQCLPAIHSACKRIPIYVENLRMTKWTCVFISVKAPITGNETDMTGNRSNIWSDVQRCWSSLTFVVILRFNYFSNGKCWFKCDISDIRWGICIQRMLICRTKRRIDHMMLNCRTKRYIDYMSYLRVMHESANILAIGWSWSKRFISITTVGFVDWPLWIAATGMCVCLYTCLASVSETHTPHIDGILPKEPYLPCVSMAGRAHLAGYPRYIKVFHVIHV